MLRNRVIGLIKLKAGDILRFEGNPKQLGDKEYKKLARSIYKDGLVSPFFVFKDDGKYRLLDGHQRLAVICLKNEDEEVPCVELDVKDYDEGRKILLLLSSQYASIDENELFNFAPDLDDMLDTINLKGLDFKIDDNKKERVKPLKLEIVFDDIDELTHAYKKLSEDGYKVSVR